MILLLSKTKLHENNNPFYFGKKHLGAGQGGAEKRIQNCYNISVSLINLTGKLAAERREREGGKKKRENENEKSRGEKFRLRVHAWVGIFSGREGSSEGVQKRDVKMGKTFGLPENRDYFSLLPTPAESKLSPFLHY